MSYVMETPEDTPVNTLGFTSGFGSEADWIVFENDGMLFSSEKIIYFNWHYLSITRY